MSGHGHASHGGENRSVPQGGGGGGGGGAAEKVNYLDPVPATVGITRGQRIQGPVGEAIVASNEVDHPAHYGGADDPYEAIKVIEAHQLGFHLGNAVKYILRAGKKPGQTEQQDLAKAIWYLERRLDALQ